MPCHNYGENKVIFQISGNAVGRFLSRDNRFLATVELNGERVKAHVHDPGRLGELLFPGNEVLLKRYDTSKRRTSWEIIASKMGKMWILTNSKFHSRIAERILKSDLSPFGCLPDVVSEMRYGKSRLDFYSSSRNLWIEVKGCTLLKGAVALFPDAPTSRGRRHVEDLIKLKGEGKRGAIIFLVFVPARFFSPNYETDPKFSESLVNAYHAGVEIHAIRLNYDGSKITYEGEIPIRFQIE